MFSRKKTEVSITIAAGVLEAIYDECDRFDRDETGGRIIGTYKQKDGHYHIQVSGILGPGPNAERSPTYFMQDGEHQERIFRAIEAKHPDIEHLGNWHTHHVNGLPTLSGGDKDTYFRTVNHNNHNTDFFYALLVVTKNVHGNPRYDIKHFFFRRNDRTVYEIPHSVVKVVDVPALSAGDDHSAAVAGAPTQVRNHGGPNVERAKDQEFFAEFYPNMKSLVSRASGTPYWKGTVELVDGSRARVVAMENGDASGPYSITTDDGNPALAAIKTKYRDWHFRSAREAVIHLEKDLNKAIYQEIKGA